jgi:hypothetical protein
MLLQTLPVLSLQAAGSGERPPDDRLREAIHLAAERNNCFIACAPRNDCNRKLYRAPKIADPTRTWVAPS